MASPHTAIDRRALITGRLLKPDRVIAPPGGEIASILVQARPDRGQRETGRGSDTVSLRSSCTASSPMGAAGVGGAPGAGALSFASC